jgi:OFA family oxalate/formate antiporter-like MFS transporter
MAYKKGQKPHPVRWPFFYGYVVAFMGTIGIWASVPGQTIGVSAFTDPVKNALGLTRDQFSAAYMVGTFMSSMLLGKAGRWFDRRGAREVGVVSALLLAITLILSSFSNIISSGIVSVIGFQHWLIPFSVMMVLFFMLRFSGQGVLTMASRNMIMKWFDHYRGRINAFVSISIALGFSSSPLLFDLLIRKWDWAGAWRFLALVIVVIAVFMWITYRDNPEDYGLVPDGKSGSQKAARKNRPEMNQFKPKEAFSTRAFWMYSLMLSFNSFFITGLSFHMVDIFTSAGLDREEAVAVFLPISLISVVVSLLFNFLSDIMPLKKLLFVMVGGALIWVIGMVGLFAGWGLWLVIIGAGISGGLFAVLNSVTWPNLFGRKHLGAISGRAMSMLVFASALAPFFFSLSKSFFNSYTSMGWLGIGFVIFVFFGSLKANNPQKV